MAVPPTESGEGEPGQVTRIAEEFIRLHEAGQLTDLDEFCARYPAEQRAHVRQGCEQLLRLHGVIVQHDRLTPGQKLGSYEDGRTLYRLRTTVDPDIWLLEMSR